MYYKAIWEDLQDFLSTKTQLLTLLTRENIVFGGTMKDNTTDLVLNNMIFMAKFFLQMEENKAPSFCLQAGPYRQSSLCFKTNERETCKISPPCL